METVALCQVDDQPPYLLGGMCRSCLTKAFPYSGVCAACGRSGDVEKVALSRHGRLYSYSIVHVAPPGLQTPYTVGFVDLDDSVRVFAQIEGSASGLSLDSLMEVVPGTVRVDGEGQPILGYKFKVAQ